MNAYSSEFHQLRSEAGRGALADPDPATSPGRVDAISARWAALHAAAAAVAGLAQIAPDQSTGEAPDFAAMIAGAPDWKVSLLRNGTDDIAAFMQSGLTALLAVNTVERNPAAAANALWTEFELSRDALLESVFSE